MDRYAMCWIEFGNTVESLQSGTHRIQQVSENMHLPIIFHSIIKRLKDLAFCVIICPVTGFLSEFTAVNTPI